jgi:hypothetical protein
MMSIKVVAIPTKMRITHSTRSVTRLISMLIYALLF